MLVLGCLPVPGPLDEVVLVLAAVPLLLFYRRPMADAWRQAGDSNARAPSTRGRPAWQPAGLWTRLTVVAGLLTALVWSCLLFGIGLDDLTDGDTRPGVIFSVVVLSLLVVVAAGIVWRLAAPYAKRSSATDSATRS